MAVRLCVLAHVFACVCVLTYLLFVSVACWLVVCVVLCVSVLLNNCVFVVWLCV